MGKTIKELRRERLKTLMGGRTQAAVAEELDGVSASYLWQLLSGKRNIGDKVARKIERSLGVPEGYLDGLAGDPPDTATPHPSDVRHIEGSQRRIPVVSYVEAGDPKEIFDDHEPGNGFEYLGVDTELADSLGPYAFALVVEGHSMAEEFQPGDRVIIDPHAPVRPGDIVVAKLHGETTATLKKYRARGNDNTGEPVFELVPLNDDYATVLVNASNPAEIIGPVVEHRRRMRR